MRLDSGFVFAKNKIFVGDLIVLERLVLSLFFAFVILDQIRGDHSIYKLGKIKVFSSLGKISYGLYMYHLIVMFLLVKLVDTPTDQPYYMILIYFVLSLTLLIGVSILSYRFIEKPLLKLKPK